MLVVWRRPGPRPRRAERLRDTGARSGTAMQPAGSPRARDRAPSARFGAPSVKQAAIARLQGPRCSGAVADWWRVSTCAIQCSPIVTGREPRLGLVQPRSRAVRPQLVSEQGQSPPGHGPRALAQSVRSHYCTSALLVCPIWSSSVRSYHSSTPLRPTRGEGCACAPPRSSARRGTPEPPAPDGAERWERAHDRVDMGRQRPGRQRLRHGRHRRGRPRRGRLAGHKRAGRGRPRRAGRPRGGDHAELRLLPDRPRVARPARRRPPHLDPAPARPGGPW